MGHVDFKIPGFLMKMRAEEEREIVYFVTTSGHHNSIGARELQ